MTASAGGRLRSAVRPGLIIHLEPHGLIALTNNDDPIRLDDLSVFLAVCEMRGFRAAA